MGRIRTGEIPVQDVSEWWIVEALQSCHDVLWCNAERGDIRGMEKRDAERLIKKNPGKFVRVDTIKYLPQEGRWLKNETGLRES